MFKVISSIGIHPWTRAGICCHHRSIPTVGIVSARLISSGRGPTNHYRTLRIRPGASPDAVKTSFYRLSKKYHPDVNPDPSAAEEFKRLSEAYRVLGNAQSRKDYDISIFGFEVKEGMQSKAGVKNHREKNEEERRRVRKEEERRHKEELRKTFDTQAKREREMLRQMARNKNPVRFEMNIKEWPLSFVRFVKVVFVRDAKDRESGFLVMTLLLVPFIIWGMYQRISDKYLHPTGSEASIHSQKVDSRNFDSWINEEMQERIDWKETQALMESATGPERDALRQKLERIGARNIHEDWKDCTEWPDWRKWREE